MRRHLVCLSDPRQLLGKKPANATLVGRHPNPRAATVKYFDGTAWQLYAGYHDNCDIENTYLSVDQTNGHPYLTYSDCNGAMTVKVQ
ncbi:MAG TPA: hypothetical protein VJ801_03120 [Polyangia bacterium]|jgi:hypothetical protein|nr:hypothetical protein [Polyangia bacterium]